MNDTEYLLDVRGLKVHFPIEKGILLKRRAGYVRAVDGVDFRIRPGEALGLVGESGCGKSTTAMAVAQLQTPTAGQVLLDGRDLAALSPQELRAARKDFQIVFQDPYSSLDPRQKAADIIAEPLRIFAKRGIITMDDAEIQSTALSLMDRCGLSASFATRYPHEFSGGQRQRIGIARALALGPRLVIADEPVSALDVSIQSQILNLLKDLQKDFNLTFLFIAHDLAVIEYFCTKIAVMYLGRIVETADSATIASNPMHPYTKALLSAAPLPDPAKERSRRRIILKGDVPSPSVEHRGCPFRERCPEAMDVCALSAPVLKPVGEGHEVSCFLYGEG
ncbi:MAG: ATP-binding cassette domain-containing protein [Spirochaetales bacterium]|nr:ATP-binding cassette domain-containing protein [Spirochaetales bacterium]